MDTVCRHEISKDIYPDFFNIHTHSRYEIYCIIRGSGRFDVEGGKYRLAPDSVIILKPGEMHRAEIDCNSIYERCFIHFDRETVLRFDPGCELLEPFDNRPYGRGNLYNRDNSDTALIRELLIRCEREAAGCTAQTDNERLDHYLYVILKEIYDSFKLEKPVVPAVYDSDKSVYEIIRYIDENIRTELSVAQLEKLFFISRPALAKRFKKATGTTVWNYIVSKRIELAERMINDGESITKAAYLCGYNDYSAFYRAYRKHCKCPPRRQ